MDQSLVAWARAVKARRGRASLPPLWLFTDPARMPDLHAAVRALPRGLCGVVFRHDGAPGRATLLREIKSLCRQRRAALVAAGDTRDLPAGVGRHLRRGRGRFGGRTLLLTSSAHGRAELVRGRRAGAALAFCSPVFQTSSHPGAQALGPAGWGRLARRAGIEVGALGGIDGRTVRRLPRSLGCVGAIGALLV